MLLAHNGVEHQRHKSSSDRSLDMSPENSEPSKNSNNSPQIQETRTVPTPIEQNSTEPSAIIEDKPVISTSETVTLVTGFGESVFALLIASPFLLFGFKKWLHR